MHWLSIFEFILCALAVYRLSLLVTAEDGPAWIFRKLRKAVPAKSSMKQGISCQLCMSIHAAGLVTAFVIARKFWLPNDHWFILGGEAVILLLAMSALSIIFHMHTTKGL